MSALEWNYASMEADGIRELDSRADSDHEVYLLWHSRAETCVLVLADCLTRELHIVPISGDLALDAFNHPFLYVRPDTVVEVGTIKSK